VHGGFKQAFDSIRDKVAAVLQSRGPSEKVLFVGHSMGGALAQLAAVYFCESRASLVTFASPAIGNRAFCAMLECCARPYGGLRVWNSFDVVPVIAQVRSLVSCGPPPPSTCSVLRVPMWSVVDLSMAYRFLTGSWWATRMRACLCGWR
jgi:pimeloyl-ACP methyl ester carboxylesterase